MDEMESRGLNYGDPAAVDSFRQEYEALALRHRMAVRLALELEHGTLTGARIDESGDLLRGKFVPEGGGEIGYVPGLDEYERSMRAADSQRAAVGGLLDEQRAQLERFRETQSRLEAQVAEAQQRSESLTAEARSHWARFLELREQAAAKEDQAIKMFKNAAASFAAASRIAMTRVSDVPAEVDEFSSGSLTREDQWLAAHADCQGADANLQAALLLYDRFRLLTRAGEVMDVVGEAAATQPSADALAASAAEAMEQGQELLDKAITTLERSSGKLRKHWTVTATVAAADYALSLFGDESLRELAIANYQSAVEGREQDELVRPYVERLEQLRDR
jgi:DNA repair exonuclease SbcCD ATPase subunit